MQMGEVHFAGLDLYMLNEPALVKKVLVEKSDDFPKNELLGHALRPLLGNSIFTTNGVQWVRQRAMMDPAFSMARMSIALPVMCEAIEAMANRLCVFPDGSVQNIEIEMTHVTADIIFRTIFSTSLTETDAHRVFSAFSRFQSLAPRLLLPEIFGIRWLVWPWDAWRSRKAATEIRQLLESMIRPRFDAHRNGCPGGEQDILAALLDSREPETDTPFSFDELVDQVAMLFLAGHETSASALTWALYLVAQSPDIQDRLHLEVVVSNSSASSCSPDIRRLNLARNIFRETLRLFPPVGFLARQSNKACPMRDKSVEARASVIVSPWLIHRHRDFWTQPDAFNPDRYQDDQSRDALQKAYLPFGMGPRVCMGAAFAMQEATLVLASVVRHFRLEALPEHVPQPVGRLTIRSANGVWLRLHRR